METRPLQYTFKSDYTLACLMYTLIHYVVLYIHKKINPLYYSFYPQSNAQNQTIHLIHRESTAHLTIYIIIMSCIDLTLLSKKYSLTVAV